MRVRPGYKVTDIGEFPQDWELVSLGKVAHFINGYPFSPSEWKSRGLPIIRIQNLNDPEAEFNYFDGNIEDRYIVSDGDLLLSWSASLGVYVWRGGKAVLNQHIFKVVPEGFVDKSYLYFAAQRSIQDLRKRVHGSTMRHFKKQELDSTLVPVPPIQEQQKIASVLSTADDAIQKTDEIIAKAQQLKKGLMQQLLAKGIGHTKFKQTEIGEIPEECECRKVGEVCEVIMGQSPPGNSYNDIGVGLPLLNGPTEFGETTPIPVQWTSQPTKTCCSNDVLLCVRGNTTGRINTADREYCIGRGVAAIRAKSGKTDSRFIKYVFQRLEPRILQVAFGAGSTFPNINRDETSSLPIPVPPLAEQLKISEIVSGVDEKTARERTRRQHLSRLKNGLMQVLLTGKVRVKVD